MTAIVDKDEKKALKDFAENTTLHGVRNVVFAVNQFLRLFWVLAMIAGLGFLCYQCVMLLLGYLSYSTMTNIDIQIMRSLKFPSVTICNFNKFSQKKLNNMSSIYNLDEDMLWKYAASTIDDEILFRISTDKWLFKEFMDESRQVEASLSAARNWDLKSLLKELAPDKEGMFFGPPDSCRWIRQECNETSFVQVATDLGYCYAFNLESHSKYIRDQYDAGDEHALTVTLNIEQSDYSERQLFGQMAAGVKVLVAEPKFHPMVAKENVVIAPGTLAMVSMQYTEKHLTNEHPWGTCINRQLKYFPGYTSEACLMECKIDIIKEYCNCTLFAYSDLVQDVAICSPTTILTCVSKIIQNSKMRNIDYCKENCHRGCHTTDYSVSASAALIPSTSVFNNAISKLNELQFPYRQISHFRENFLRLTIYYKTLEAVKMEQTPQKRWECLMSDIGGQMGLCVGASVMTVVELGQWLIYSCFLRCKKRNRTNPSSISASKNI